VVSQKKNRSKLLTAFKIAIAVIVLADAIGRPLYRPFLEWVASWRLVEAMERGIAKLPRSAILVLFAIPFVIAEPLKVVALLLIASGNVIIGVPLIVFAYLVTFLLVERIYHAGRDKLLSYAWFAWGMGHVAAVRDYLSAVKKQVFGGVRRWTRRFGI
jgi:hypothetical protein